MSSDHYYFPILTDAGMYQQILVEIPKLEIPRKPSGGSGAFPCRYRGISKLMIAFRNCFENTLKIAAFRYSSL